MRAALVCLMMAAVVLVHGTARAGEIHRGPSARESAWTPSPIVITPADRVRIQMVANPERVPTLLRGQFAGSIAGANAGTLTVVLDDGQPAVVHRDLVEGLEVRVDHGSRGKHALVGAFIGGAVGALIGLSSDGGDSGDLIYFSPGEMAAMGAIIWAPIGAIIGTAIPAGESWKPVPLERVQWSPGP